MPCFVNDSTLHLIKCNIAFPSATKTVHYREAVMCCFLGGGGGGFLSTSNKAQLQRDIVHLSQISCLCNCLSTSRPSSVGKNTLSCGCEITDIYVVVHHWACQRTKNLDVPRTKPQRRPGTVNGDCMERSPYGFQINIPRQTYCTYMIPLDAQSSPCLELPQEEGTKLQIQASILDGYKGKMESEDKACSAYLELMFPPFFFPFPSQVLNILLKPIKIVTTC